MGKTFVGIGFGAIQGGLFLREAQNSGNFDRLVVAEVMPEVVTAVRKAGGRCWINIAKPSHLRSSQLSGIEVFNPLAAEDAAALVDAITDADEIGVALPSIDFYERGAPCPADLLARGLSTRLSQNDSRPVVVYAAENHNRAAELLRDAVSRRLESTVNKRLAGRVQFVNTVIGKMSGVVTDRLQIQRDGLVPLADGIMRALLVEEFNDILIDEITLPDFNRGIRVFREARDLLPFEEAKLYGHNAAHALLGYLAHRQHMTFIHEAAKEPLLEVVEQALLEESGVALCQRYGHVDPLFTNAGWRDYTVQLLHRMLNPFLRDGVERVIRDPRRKLGWDDRLVGTMRLALASGIEPRRYAMGAAAAAELLLSERSATTLESLLDEIWGFGGQDSAPRSRVFALIEHARKEM